MKEKLLDTYSDNYKLRALVNILPYIGGALDVLLSEKGSKWREKRLLKLLSEIDIRIEKIESTNSSNIIPELTDSEEFYDLLMQSFNSVIKTRHDRKISSYANILVNHIVGQDKSDFSAELMLAILDNMTIQEIEYLSKLYNSNNKITTYTVFGKEIYWNKYLYHIEQTGSIANSEDQLPKRCLFPFDLNLIWKMLSDKNIVIIDKIEKFGSLPYSFRSSNMSLSGEVSYSKKVVYRISDFGEVFVKWILNDQE